MAASDRTALYRLYGADNVLLYVGIAGKPDSRWKQHSRQKEWWPKVTRKTLAWYETRAEAEAEELAAMAAERPVYNVAGSPHRPEPGSPLRPHTTAPFPGGVSSDTARRNLFELLNEVRYQSKHVMITRRGKPVAKLVPLSDEDLKDDDSPAA